MNLPDIKEQINTWLDKRLNSPYFGAVIAVWLVTNRVMIFGLFNFTEEMTLEDRIGFVHNQLNSFQILWVFKGFYGTIIWSLLWGFIIMIVFDQINTFAKVGYKWAHKTKAHFLRQIEPENWVEKEHFIQIEKERKEFEDDSNLKRTELNKITKENELLISENIKISEQNKNNSEKLIKNEKQLKEFLDDQNSFKITYAQYGTERKNMEVTRKVSELLRSTKSFIVCNHVLGLDPHHNHIKTISVQYVFNNQYYNLNANEEEEIIFKENNLISKPNRKSENLQIWTKNNLQIDNYFSDNWVLEISKNDYYEVQNIQIINGDFYIEGEHKYDLLVPVLNEKKIQLKKVDLITDVVFSIEDLKINTVNKNYIGNDDKGFKLSYTKNEEFNIAINIPVRDREKIISLLTGSYVYNMNNIETKDNKYKTSHFTLKIFKCNTFIQKMFEKLLLDNNIKAEDFQVL